MKRVFFCIPPLLILLGCVNPYSKFYNDLTEGTNVLEDPRFIISEEQPKLMQGSDKEKDFRMMLENGYFCLGVSSFNGESVSRNAAIAHAKKIHADTIITYSKYANTISGSRPVTVPDTQTSITNHSGNIYGSGGEFANYSGTGHTTTYGTKTTYVPYSVNRYDYFASFWVKTKPPHLGVHYEDLTDDLRKKIESNKGVYVTVVVKDSPAFHNDILSGDIIRKLNKIEVIDKSQFKYLIDENKGTEVDLEIYRQGETIVKKVQLN